MERIWKDTEVFDIISFYSNGGSINDLSKKYSCAKYKITELLENNNIQRHRQLKFNGFKPGKKHKYFGIKGKDHPRYRVWTALEIQEMLSLYKTGKYINELAKRFNTRKCTIVEFLNENNIKRHKLSKLTSNIFISRSQILHGNLYDYSMVNYKKSTSKVDIICKKHGVFKQTPPAHLHGQGCPTCVESNGEREISKLLEKSKIKFVRNFVFNSCKYKGHLKFDFYLPKYNSCIEYDGIQHFIPIKYFGIKNFKDGQIKDKIKNKYCKNNGIPLFRIKYTDNIEKSIKLIIKKINN